MFLKLFTNSKKCGIIYIPVKRVKIQFPLFSKSSEESPLAKAEEEMICR